MPLLHTRAVENGARGLLALVRSVRSCRVAGLERGSGEDPAALTCHRVLERKPLF